MSKHEIINEILRDEKKFYWELSRQRTDGRTLLKRICEEAGLKEK